MNKSTIEYIGIWLAFSLLLFGAHYYILFNFASGKDFYFPLSSIYFFNSLSALIIYFAVKRQFSRNIEKTYQAFLVLTMIKMFLAIVFLLPLFLGKSSFKKIEAFNFFIPYFLFLIFEIFSLNNFFKNQKTK